MYPAAVPSKRTVLCELGDTRLTIKTADTPALVINPCLVACGKWFTVCGPPIHDLISPTSPIPTKCIRGTKPSAPSPHWFHFLEIKPQLNISKARFFFFFLRRPVVWKFWARALLLVSFGKIFHKTQKVFLWVSIPDKWCLMTRLPPPVFHVPCFCAALSSSSFQSQQYKEDDRHTVYVPVTPNNAGV